MIDYEYSKKFYSKYVKIYFVGCDEILAFEGHLVNCFLDKLYICKGDDVELTKTSIPLSLISKVEEMTQNEVIIYKLKGDL